MRVRDILLAVLVALIWGLTFVVIKLGLEEMPPLFFSALRFLCAAFPAVLLFGRRGIPWRIIFWVGLVLGVGMYSLLYLGVKLGMPAGLSSLVLQAQVFFTASLSAFFLKDPPLRWQKVGIAVALGGIALLASTQSGSVHPFALLLVLGAAVAWAIANILIKRAGQVDMFRLMIWMSLVPPLPLLLFSAVFERHQGAVLTGMSLRGFGAILYTGLLATVVAFSLWGRLFRIYSPNQVAPFALLVPVFGMAGARLLLHEELTLASLLAAALVLLGLVMVVAGGRRPGLRPWTRPGGHPGDANCTEGE
ncbi:EamA family transporter [Archangium sp.]|uniref:EamA family transporter n=1 Tax=Archangium sp. TaxID=1872627 RepID=UPI002D2870EA|nr:EamA family transporter [Archangium sp.]HYO55644.1 EamA family transporter [Archangium sp.]